MNECKIVEDLIPLYAEDLTNEEAAEFVKNHVERCDHCRKLLERCTVSVPTPEEDAKAYKKAMRKNVLNMTCRIVVVALLFFVVLYLGLIKWDAHLRWLNGRAPVEQVVIIRSTGVFFYCIIIDFNLPSLLCGTCPH